jgi:ectoine hydroxylase-related dioxygenase (phytanoyl-CoA dioxygenase family)
MIFSDPDTEQFIEDGYVVLRQAFPREVAASGQSFIRSQIGSIPEGAARPRQRIIHLREVFSGAPFDRVMNPRLHGALEHLMGAGRAIIHGHFGWWPVLLPGFAGPGGWHVDGTGFQHHLTSPEQGLVTVFLFSDVAPGDGGTAIVRGSHQSVAQLLASAEPAGLSDQQLHRRLPRVKLSRVVELTGEAGDVAMLHPFVIHGFSANRGSRIRFACNPRYSLSRPMELDRADGAHSPVEEAIRRALTGRVPASPTA